MCCIIKNKNNIEYFYCINIFLSKFYYNYNFKYEVREVFWIEVCIKINFYFELDKLFVFKLNVNNKLKVFIRLIGFDMILFIYYW